MIRCLNVYAYIDAMGATYLENQIYSILLTEISGHGETVA